MKKSKQSATETAIGKLTDEIPVNLSELERALQHAEAAAKNEVLRQAKDQAEREEREACHVEQMAIEEKQRAETAKYIAELEAKAVRK